jgi:hypothetical protein
MPLARIVTWLAEDIDALEKDLRARGFEVVTKSPDEISSEPADLEITVEECASEQALISASGIARAQDKCVFIAPGAITENPRPLAVTPPLSMGEPELAYDSLQPSESDEFAPLAAIHQLQDASELQQQPVHQVLEPVDISTVSEPEVSESALETVSDAQFAVPLTQELAAPWAEVTEPLGVEEQEQEQLATHNFSANSEPFSTLTAEHVLPLVEESLAPAELVREESIETQTETLVVAPELVQAEPVALVKTEALSEIQPETVVEVPPVFEAEPVSLAETQALSEIQPETVVDVPPVFEAEPVSLIETQMIAEIQPETIAEAPAIFQMNTAGIESEPTSDWPIWHPLVETEIPVQDSLVPESLFKHSAPAIPLSSRTKTVFQQQLPQVVPLMQSGIPVRPNTYRQRMLQKSVVQNDEVFWKTATVLAMVAVAALLVGASANRFSPLPANVVRSIEVQQPVPFEKAKIVPTLSLDAGNKPGAVELPPQGPDVARFHRALAIQPAAPRIVPEAAAGGSQGLVRTKPQRHSAGHPDSDMVAEDTVVRYDKKHPPASHTQAQKNSGVKQYSDLD